MLGAGVIVAIGMAFTRGDVLYLLVLVWAFVGIAVKHADNSTVATAAWIATGLVSVLVLISLIKNRNIYQVATG
jgi:hypothetical protein